MEEITFTPYDYLAFAMLIIGLGLVLSQFVNLLFRLNINNRAMTDAIIKLVQENNIERAIKLCEVIPAVPYAQGMKGALQALQSGQSDSISLTMQFNQALQSQRMDMPQSYSMPSAGEMQFPALKKRMTGIRIRVACALLLALVGAGLHYVSVSEAPDHFFYGPAGAVLFLFVLSLKETHGILVKTKTEFARFCDAMQGGTDS